MLRRTSMAAAAHAARRRDARNALLAGVAGTLAVTLFEAVETAALGREPIYSACRVARRMFARRRHARLAGWALRWSYGTLLGLAVETLPSRGGVVERALTIGFRVFVFELVAMPLVGATPPVSAWPRSHVVSLAVHTTAFGIGATIVNALSEGRRVGCSGDSQLR